jgi:ATP-dependent helicase Lhr and Lhr-like helicase
MMDSLQRDRAVAGSLARTWDAFFARFGRLTPVQREAMPHVLSGADVLVCSPTASGKTEAVCAPLIERNLSSPRWTILYVSPTRALVNDLYQRLVGPCAILDVKVARRTGDHPSRSEWPPNVLITTPESFDSLLCRAKGERIGHFLAYVSAVVLDEVHLLHGTPRGEQVRWLLRRLARLRVYAASQGWTRDSRMQVCALSATVDDVRAVAETCLREATLVQTPGGRLIEQVSVPCDSPAVEDALPALLSTHGAPDKILVFSNTRKRVDALAHELRQPLVESGYKMCAHHGSLDRKLREEAEQTAKQARRVVLFATSTLEIGIDIGDIDLVVLDGPAPDVGSLLQRIGRGNRRTGQTRVMTCSGSLAEVLIHAAMIRDASDGHIPRRERGPQYAVARQQLSSYIFQSSTSTRRRTTLEQLTAECLLAPRAAELIDHFLSQREWMEVPTGLRLGQNLVDAAVRGEIHSNIENPLGQTVVEERSGAVIAGGVRFKSGRGMLIGGQLLKVRESSGFRLSVQATADRQVAEGNWSYVSGAWFQGAGQPDSVRRFLGVGDDVWPVVEDNGVSVVFHFGGARRQAVIGLVHRALGIPGFVRVDPWTLRVTQSQVERPPAFQSLNPGSLEVTIGDRLGSLERTLARPRANARLPRSWRIAEVREWLTIEEECRALRTSTWQVAADPEMRAQLRVLATALRYTR